jgi:hypothetical protein
MRKKILYILLILCVFLVAKDVNATSSCSYEDQANLNSTSANVKLNYNVETELVDKSQYIVPDSIAGTEEESTYELSTYYFKVSVLNVTDKIYVVIKNNQDNNQIRINYGDTTDGSYSFNWTNLENVTNLTANIYSSASTSCPDELYQTMYLTLPRYNENQFDDICNNYPDYYLCQKFVTYDSISYDDFLSKMNSYDNQQTESETNQENTNLTVWQKILNFISNNKVYFIAGIVIVLMGATTVIILKKRRSSR